MTIESTLIIIGTCHSHQEFSVKPASAAKPERFQFFLEKVVNELDPDLIAEEYSEELLERDNVIDTVPRRVAGSRISHQFCEMSSIERRENEIEDRVSYRTRSLWNGIDRSEEQLLEFEKTFFPIRESYWLGRLAANTFKTCIMVIGANHVATFPERARLAGYNVCIHTKKWDPNR